MLLCEADGKALLGRHGVPVPQGLVLPEDAVPDAGRFPVRNVVKAQLLSGSRGKSGLISLAHADTETAITAMRTRLGERGDPAVVLVEEAVDARAEYYLSLIIDDVAQCVEVLFSTQGGMAVEDHRARLHRFRLPAGQRLKAQDLLGFFRDAGAASSILGRLCRLTADLHRIMLEEDADLIEINPLMVTQAARLVAADAKISLDDSAWFRHADRGFELSRRLNRHAMSELERAAADRGFTCVEMPGDVAMVTAGAGLGMMMIDLLGDAGFQPACFFDNAAGGLDDTTEARLRVAFLRAEAADVRAILFFQMLATRDLKTRIQALLATLDAIPPPKPLYFGISASYVAEREMTTAQACQLLEERGYSAAADPGELVARMAADRDAGRLTKGG